MENDVCYVVLVKKVLHSKKSGKPFDVYSLRVTKAGKKPVEFYFDFKRMFEFSAFLRSLMSIKKFEFETIDLTEPNENK